MEGNEEKEVVMSGKSIEDIDQIRVYGEETFGERKADEYHQSFMQAIKSLETGYLMHSECQQLVTQRKIYRRIIVESHIIIYRIAKRVEVLRVLHSASSNRKIRSARTERIP